MTTIITDRWGFPIPQPPQKPPTHYILGADLGQANDPTAFAIIDMVTEKNAPIEEQPQPEPVRKSDTLPSMFYAHLPGGREPASQPIITPSKRVRAMLPHNERRYNRVHLERVPLGTSYPKVVELTQKRIEALKERAGDGGRVQLAVDATGVGRPVVDLLVQAKLKPISVVITGGDQVTRSGGFWRVPKRDLIGML